MNHLLFSAAVLALAATAAAAPAATNLSIPAPAEILAKLRTAHPRLFATASDFDQLKQRVATDPQLKTWHEELRREAEKLLAQAPSKYEIPDGLRLLSVSRRVLHRTQLLALLHRLDGDPRWRDRAWAELEAAARFPDWNPRHFLDTAEMTHAFALGYDWLFDAWSPKQRAMLRAAMVEKGLKPALEIHRKKSGWTRARHNWNQVCNGGIGMGALALAEEEPQMAGEFLHDALLSIQLPMAEFAPDGAWAEGPGYWNYATTYNVAFLAALETSLGTDFGLAQMSGFADTGLFPIYFGTNRWTYYRLRAEGQNTLVLNPGAGPDQAPSAAARLERFESDPAQSFAIADLTPAYAQHAHSVRRGVALLDRRRFLVQDEIRADAPVDAWWFMHTPAEIEIAGDGRSAILKQGDATLRAALLSPAQAKFEARAAEPLPGSPNPEQQNRNAGIRKLTVHVTDARDLRLVVLLTPQHNGSNAAAARAVRSLAEW